MGADLNLEQLSDRLAGVETIKSHGRIRAAVGLAIEADLPGARIGQLVRIERGPDGPLLAEVAGFRDQVVMLLPLGEAAGLSSNDSVHPVDGGLTIEVGPGLLGRVLDGLGRPIDGLGPLRPSTGEQLRRWPFDGRAPAAMGRAPIRRALPLGIRAIDGLMTVGEGQRLGLFAGAGVGKSLLLAQIARQTQADVFVVCLVGERGRELREFIETGLMGDRSRGVVVCAQSDEAPLLRVKSAQLATAIAEGFRDQGKRVVLLMDSLSRYARALREVALALGELPARRGYPPSVFAALPRLLERAGLAGEESGSITALYSVLVEGDDLDEPIADELRGLLDGHIVLSRQLASRGHYPAIDVVNSLSRVMPAITDASHLAAATRLRKMLAIYEQQRDLIALGAYSPGADHALDEAVAHIEAIELFLVQEGDERATFDDTLETLQRIMHQA